MPSSEEVESGLSRIKELMSKHAAGVITAYQRDLSIKENTKCNRKLLAVLMSHGYRVFTIKGKYIINFASSSQRFVWEEHYLVVNDKVEGDDGGELEVELIELGKFFDQEHFVSIRSGVAHLVGTSTQADAYPPFGQSVASEVATFDAAYGDFFSFVVGEHLMYEEVVEVEELRYPGAINGIRVMKMYATEVRNSIQEQKSNNILPFRRR